MGCQNLTLSLISQIAEMVCLAQGFQQMAFHTVVNEILFVLVS
jgi:hypothetical protein